MQDAAAAEFLGNDISADQLVLDEVNFAVGICRNHFFSRINCSRLKINKDGDVRWHRMGLGSILENPSTSLPGELAGLQLYQRTL